MAGTTRHRALRIIGGLVGMAVFVAAVWLVLSRLAGGWGVPYFSFTTENGSGCTNTWTGYVCTSITPEDYQLYTGQPLPPGTEILSARYTVTHDYRLRAVLRTAEPDAAAAYRALSAAYGGCSGGPTPDELEGARSICRMTTDNDGTSTDKPPPPQTYTVTTGLLKNGQRVTVVQIQSR